LTATARGGYRPLIVGYHRVVENFDAAAANEIPSLLVSRPMFEHHLDGIGRHFRFLSLDEIEERVANGAPFPEPVAAVTFDDGYADVYEHAFPVMVKKGIPGAVFVVTDLIGSPTWQVHDRLCRLLTSAFTVWQHPRRELTRLLASVQLPGAHSVSRAATGEPAVTAAAMLPHLSREDTVRLLGALAEVGGDESTGTRPQCLGWSELRAMRRAGFVIGSHTCSHARLPVEPLPAVDKELAESKRVLEEGLGERITHFAYPGGEFAPAVVDAVARAGYRLAYTACPHGDARHPQLTLPRLLLWERSSIGARGQFSAATLNCQIHGLWPPSRQCARVHSDR
jgi:peptidoglycan/xylan/chitin deacetylase (PgdA/CDA1 family)